MDRLCGMRRRLTVKQMVGVYLSLVTKLHVCGEGPTTLIMMKMLKIKTITMVGISNKVQL